mmetsp:Transcript_5216/g.14955  ORF Transcript_5216/g.14955 Transcript_5216/m.14955 type:complete len:102 (-) Transcript_5216:531-836(-)
MAQALQWIQGGAIVLVLTAERMLPALGLDQDPSFYQVLKERRFPIIAGVWLFGNMVQSSLTSTGAFEVFYDGRLVHSKLATGHLPQMEELLHLVGTAMQKQ